MVHPDTKPRECAGALIMVIRHVNECGTTAKWEDYRKLHKNSGLTRPGLALWVQRYLFGDLPGVDSHRADEVGLPW